LFSAKFRILCEIDWEHLVGLVSVYFSLFPEQMKAAAVLALVSLFIAVASAAPLVQKSDSSSSSSSSSSFFFVPTFFLFCFFQQARQNKFCDSIASILPQFCNVTFCDPAITTTVFCVVDLLQLDTFFVEMDLNLCATPVNINFTVIENSIGLYFNHDVKESISIPIPSLVVDLPDVGKAGVFIVVSMGTGVDMVDLSVGVDACATILGYSVCEPTVCTLTRSEFFFFFCC
jgi:hypothetical protein